MNSNKRRSLSLKKGSPTKNNSGGPQNGNIVNMFQRQWQAQTACTTGEVLTRSISDSGTMSALANPPDRNRLSLKRLKTDFQQPRSSVIRIKSASTNDSAVSSAYFSKPGMSCVGYDNSTAVNDRTSITINSTSLHADEFSEDVCSPLVTEHCVGTAAGTTSSLADNEVIEINVDADQSASAIDDNSSEASNQMCGIKSSDSSSVNVEIDSSLLGHAFDSDIDDTNISYKATSVDANGMDSMCSTSSDLNKVVEDAGSARSGNPYYIPYYLESFLLVLNTILKDLFYSYLFNDEDLKVVGAFRSLSEPAQKLYVRLFLRKHKWIRLDKIVYKDISDDMSALLKELCVCDLLIDDAKMTSVDDVVGCLPAPSLKLLAKSLQLNCTSVKKDDLVSLIIKHTKQKNVSSFFTRTSNATAQMVLKRAKSLLGQCYRLDPVARAVFARMMMLFGLHNSVSDDQNSGQQQVFQMLMTSIGRIKFPEYTIHRETRIFIDRDSLVRFVEALAVEAELLSEIEQKDYDAAYQRYVNVETVAESIIENPDFVRHDRSLPLHLRNFTAGAVHTRLLTSAVELLQFTKRYSDAVKLLRYLLDNCSVYHVDYRGRWFDRLVLNMDYHLKQPVEALRVIKSALNDPWVRAGRRYNLFLRAKKISQLSTLAKSSAVKELWNDLSLDPMSFVRDPVAVTITGRQLPHAVPGSTPLYVSPESCRHDNDNVTVFTRVEDVALRHYADLGYTEGVHAEGSSVRTLFTLLLWDVIFMSGIPDVFYNLFQTFPLDLHSDNFYVNRKDAIENRLQLISDSTEETLCAMAGETWDKNYGTLCLGISWELFRDRDHALGLVRCIGGGALAGIFRRVAELNRFVTGGFPDLTVWNPETKKFRIVEVKGPGDRLSTKQILWLNYLTELGVDAEVCYVKAVSSRRI